MVHPATFAVCPLASVRLDRGVEVGRAIATGFLWRAETDWFLVTNWHNVTGRNPDTGKCLGSFTPTHLEVGIRIRQQLPTGKEGVLSQTISIPLYTEDRPNWLEHPTRHVVDCVALPLWQETLPPSLFSKALNEADLVTKYTPDIGDDCFVVGYPKGLAGHFNTPIWKRASIASEPDLDHNSLPMLLVDTATREGMSGSPVLVRHSGL